MSSMRVGQRRVHRERAQPQEREKWGILEKHKDYSLRAKDYNEKKKRLKILRQKAAERNPDEFHFAMMRSKTNDSGHKNNDRGNTALSHDVVKLLKTQDAGYLRNAIQRTSKLRTKEEQQLQLQSHAMNSLDPLGDGRNDKFRKHIAFADLRDPKDSANGPEVEALTTTKTTSSQPSPQLQETPMGVDPAQGNGSLVKTHDSDLTQKEARVIRKRKKRELLAKENRLGALKKREDDLRVAEREIGIQRGRIAATEGGINKAGVHWKNRERKR